MKLAYGQNRIGNTEGLELALLSGRHAVGNRPVAMTHDRQRNEMSPWSSMAWVEVCMIEIRKDVRHRWTNPCLSPYLVSLLNQIVTCSL